MTVRSRTACGEIVEPRNQHKQRREQKEGTNRVSIEVQNTENEGREATSKYACTGCRSAHSGPREKINANTSRKADHDLQGELGRGVQRQSGGTVLVFYLECRARASQKSMSRDVPAG